MITALVDHPVNETDQKIKGGAPEVNQNRMLEQTKEEDSAGLPKKDINLRENPDQNQKRNIEAKVVPHPNKIHIGNQKELDIKIH